MNVEILDEGLNMPKASSVDNARAILDLKIDYAELHKKVKNGRLALYFMIGFGILGFLVEGVQTDFEPLIMGINALFVGLYVISAIISLKKPQLGLALGITILAIILILTFLSDPMQILRGLLVRGIILYYLFIGVSASKEYIRILRELKNFGVTNLEGSELV